MRIRRKYRVFNLIGQNSVDYNIETAENSQKLEHTSLNERRLAFLLGFILLELVLLKFTLHPQSGDYDGDYAFLGFIFVPALIYFSLGFVLMISTRMPIIWKDLVSGSIKHGWKQPLALQIICYVLLIYSASRLVPSDFAAFEITQRQRPAFDLLLLATSVLFTLLLSMGTLAPKNWWLYLIRKERTALLLAFALAVSGSIASFLVQNSWDALAKPTMTLSRSILGLLYSDVHSDLNSKILGTSRFTVVIGYRCSGYEGIGMVIAFLTWYLASFKDQFRFPAALLLFPLGIATIWTFNAVRVAALIAVGTSVSPDIAMHGFHSHAGLISFIMVSLGLIYLAKKMGILSRNAASWTIACEPTDVLIIPLLVMVATTLITSLFSAQFHWLYPFRILATGIAILILWKKFGMRVRIPSPIPIFGGALAFLVWIALVHPVTERDQQFDLSLSSAPAWVSLGWIATRFFGTSIVVPIAEELAFRGYLVELISGKMRNASGVGKIQWFPMIVSSLLFGALHGSWIAAAIAGAIYYFVMSYSGRLWDAVISHMTTNLLLAIYVLTSGRWSYW